MAVIVRDVPAALHRYLLDLDAGPDWPSLRATVAPAGEGLLQVTLDGPLGALVAYATEIYHREPSPARRAEVTEVYRAGGGDETVLAAVTDAVDVGDGAFLGLAEQAASSWPQGSPDQVASALAWIHLGVLHGDVAERLHQQGLAAEALSGWQLRFVPEAGDGRWRPPDEQQWERGTVRQLAQRVRHGRADG